MREILFRGKRKGNGEWVFGDLVHFPDRTKIDTHKNGQPWRGYDVDPDTVGQFTGLLDKNGKRIFEGDIVRNADGYLFSAQYNFCVKYNEGRFWGDADGFVDVCGAELRYCEVIGNIHNNPELLEVEE